MFATMKLLVVALVVAAADAGPLLMNDGVPLAIFADADLLVMNDGVPLAGLADAGRVDRAGARCGGRRGG